MRNKPRMRKTGSSGKIARKIRREKRTKHCKGWLLLGFFCMFIAAPATIVLLRTPASGRGQAVSPKAKVGSVVQSITSGVKSSVLKKEEEEEGLDNEDDLLQALLVKESELREVVSEMKRNKVVMERDGAALKATHDLQVATRELLVARYGKTDNGKYLVEMQVQFPKMMPDASAGLPFTGKILIETAPIRLMPHAVYLFLEIVRTWQSGSFHRNAGHVLQTTVRFQRKDLKRLAFQEYSKNYPHVKGTLGFAGRPGGAAFYISTVDNTRNHGPGSQGSKTEADSCFGRVIEGQDVVERLSKVWGKDSAFTRSRMGFLDKKSQHAIITSMKIIPS